MVHSVNSSEIKKIQFKKSAFKKSINKNKGSNSNKSNPYKKHPLKKYFLFFFCPFFLFLAAPPSTSLSEGCCRKSYSEKNEKKLKLKITFQSIRLKIKRHQRWFFSQLNLAFIISAVSSASSDITSYSQHPASFCKRSTRSFICGVCVRCVVYVRVYMLYVCVCMWMYIVAIKRTHVKGCSQLSCFITTLLQFMRARWLMSAENAVAG